MSEITALAKVPCASCGAQAEWNPSKQRLVCPFCGTEAPATLDLTTGTIEEIDLVRTLRELPEELRGWKAEKRTVQCQSCRAVSVFDPDRVAQNCEFCGSPQLVDYEAIKAPIRPQSLLPFRIDQGTVREHMRRWFGTKWLAPGALKRRALIDTVHGVYIPYWTFDARVSCDWTADAGHYYYVAEEYRDDRGRRQMRQVRKVRWEPAGGHVDHFFDDEPVPGTHGVKLDLLKAVEPFPTQELVHYDAAFVSGFVVEHYQVVLFDAAQQSERQMMAKLEQLCAAQVPGDTYRNLRLQPNFDARTFKHILVPVWLLTYNYGARVFQVVANGYTGAIAGEYPKSFWKIFFLVLLIALIVLFVLWAQD